MPAPASMSVVRAKQGSGRERSPAVLHRTGRSLPPHHAPGCGTPPAAPSPYRAPTECRVPGSGCSRPVGCGRVAAAEAAWQAMHKRMAALLRWLLFDRFGHRQTAPMAWRCPSQRSARMTTLNRLTVCPTARGVPRPEADEGRGPAAARRFDPADSRCPAPARLGADPGRPAPAAVLETLLPAPCGGRHRGTRLAWRRCGTPPRRAGCSEPPMRESCVAQGGPAALARIG